MSITIRKLFLMCILSTGILLYTGCDSLLDTEAPEEVDPELAQQNLEGMESLLVSIHSRHRATARYGNSLVLGPDVLADNTVQHSTQSGRYANEAINVLGSHFSNQDGELWNTAYNVINEANYLIEGVDDLPEEEADEEIRSQLRGEAYFMRAFAYHDLVRTYAYEPGREVDGWDEGVVIREEATRDLSDAEPLPRSTNQEVYDLIVEDLERAIDNLEGNDRDDVYYANYEAALALMARVQLYLENWEEAEDYATRALDETDVELVDAETYAENIFEEDPNPESILELNINHETETLGSNDAINQYINPVGYFDVVPSESLLDSYGDDDVRLELYEEADDGFPYITKFNGSKGSTTDNIPLIRYSELLLIRAEANAELDNPDEAQDDLETLRTARGLESYDPLTNPAPTGDDLDEAILDENRREFAFEGHRWFDLKRRGMDIPKQEGAGTDFIDYDDNRVLAPIPTSEVEDFDEVVKQNPGY